jgi:hypothetical protein
MKTYLLFGLALLASCGEAPPSAPNEGLVEPGKWIADLTVESIDVPGMPPEMVDAYKAQYEIHRSKCITPDDAKTPDRLLFGRPDGCEYSRQQMAGGRISATMNCESPAATQTIQLEGTYQKDRYKLHVNGMVDDRNERRTVSYVASLDARRTGACTADQ